MVLSYSNKYRKAIDAFLRFEGKQFVLPYGGITRIRFEGYLSLYFNDSLKYRPLAMNENYAKLLINASYYR
jgi:hypothetical protein